MHKIILPLTALLLSGTLAFMGAGLQGVLVPVRAELENFPEFTIGLLFSMFYGGILLGCLLCPRAIRRAGHIRCFTAMTAIAATVPLLHAIFPNVWAWMGLRFLTGMCFAGITMVLESWLNDIATPQSRGRILSLYTMVALFALTIGQLFVNFDDPASFALFSLTAILISLAAVPLAMTRTVAPEPPQYVRLQLRRLYDLSPVGVVGCLTAGLVTGAFWGFAPVAVLDAGLSVAMVSLFMSAAVLGGALMQWPLGWYSDRRDRRIVLIIASVLTGTAALALALARTEGLVLILLAAAYGSGMHPLYSLSVAHANDYVERSETVNVSSGLLLVFAGGAVAGPILAGGLIEITGSQALFGFTTATLLVFIVFVLLRVGARPKGAPDATRDPFVTYPSTSQAVYRLAPQRRNASKG